MNWLARQKNMEAAPTTSLQNLQKPPFAGFVGEQLGPSAKINSQARPQATATIRCESNSANDPAVVADTFRPMTAADMDRYLARVALFAERDLRVEEAEEFAERLLQRDWQYDERSVCLECAHLYGIPTARRCSQWKLIGLITCPAIQPDSVDILQRCKGFTHKTRRRT